MKTDVQCQPLTFHIIKLTSEEMETWSISFLEIG